MVQLTDEEIASITSEKDIRVHIIGVDYSNENIFIIDIQDSLGLPLTLYANDLENKLIGAIFIILLLYQWLERFVLVNIIARYILFVNRTFRSSL